MLTTKLQYMRRNGEPTPEGPGTDKACAMCVKGNIWL